MKGVPQSPELWRRQACPSQTSGESDGWSGQFASESTVFQSDAEIGAEIGSRLCTLHSSLGQRVSLLQTFGDFGSIAIALELNPSFGFSYSFRAKP
jgi:hypothetical protein